MAETALPLTRPDISAGLRAHYAERRERWKERSRKKQERLALRPVLRRVDVVTQDAAGFSTEELRDLARVLKQANGDRDGERDLGILPNAAGPLLRLLSALEEYRAETGYVTRNRATLLR